MNCVPVRFVRHGRRDHGGLSRHRPQLLARIGSIDQELTGSRSLHDDVASCRQRAAIPRTAVLRAPDLLLMHGVPGLQIAHHRLVGSGSGIGREIPSFRLCLVVLGLAVPPGNFLRRNIDQAGLRAVRHGLPGMCAERPGQYRDLLAGLIVADVGHLPRAPRLHVHAARPGDLDEVVGRDQFAGGANR